jgi:hypothetical protein
MPFTEEQAPFFFGRDRERDIIIANLMAARLTLFYGPSGVGKSSVLNAGVACELRRRASADVASGRRAEFAVVLYRTWRDEPLAGLERAIEHATGITLRGATFVERLQACCDELDGDLLLVLDQFEEFFVYHQSDVADLFSAELARAVNRRELRASFLVSMREDSIAKLDSFKGRIPNLFDNRLSIERLSVEQARQAIVRPIEQLNRMLASTDEHWSIEPELVDVVLEEVKAHPPQRDDSGLGRVRADADDGIETPHLQLVMTRLWQEEQASNSHVLRLATLRRLGGASEIVRKHVDSALDALSPSERDAAATIFQYLVTPAGTKIALGVEDLSPNAGMSPADLRALLVKLAAGDSRILTTVAPAPDQPALERYQIFHDVLAQKVLEWRSRYVKEKEQRAAEAVAEEERRKAEKEAKAASRLRRALALVGVLFLVAVAAAWFAWRQTQEANAGHRMADAASLEAQSQKQLADAARLEVLAANAQATALNTEKDKFRLLAEEADARLAGRNADAAKLQAEARAADARVATEREQGNLKAAQFTAQAQQARAAAQVSQQQADALKDPKLAVPNEYKSSDAAATPAATPSAAAPAAGTPTPVPGVDAAGGTASTTAGTVVRPPTPTVAVGGDYKETYRKAIDAKNRKRWDSAVQLFQAAVQQNGTDTGERISISGFGNIEPYLPKYYLGVSLQNLGRCADAVKAFDDSERDGAVKNTNIYKSLVQSRTACQGKP